MNSDLKNSGEIEADADLIMMLYRDEVYNPESPAKGIAEINVTKQRNGELGTIYRRFYNGHFLPIDQELAKQRSAPQQKAQTRRYSKKGIPAMQTIKNIKATRKPYETGSIAQTF